MNHIELFAGCGGLSLGLESAGFELLLANELSPMASETFAYNLLGEDLTNPRGRLDDLKTKWLSSQYEIGDMAQRLKEDPRKFPALGKGKCDITTPDSLEGSLIVGSLVQLNAWLASSGNSNLLNAIKQGFNGDGVDLVSGGPPCQSFSMAGMREYENARNILPEEFAKFVKMVQPRMALLENVTGILRPFSVDGKKVYAWFEVAKAFAASGYVPLCLHVNARLAGVAQSRPRFLMILFREDIYQAIAPSLNEAERTLMDPSWLFYESAKQNGGIPRQGLEFFDVNLAKHLPLFESSFLRPLVKNKNYNVRDAIDDLKDDGGERSEYVEELDAQLRPFVFPHENEGQGNNIREGGLENHEQRENNPLVKRRFRIYQVLAAVTKEARKEAILIMNGVSTSLSQASAHELSRHIFKGEDGKNLKFKKGDNIRMVDFFVRHRTKKRTQKALDPQAPAPAALSIPDDACHYEDLRTLSVREMARIQSFPDNFVFRSKITTGGQMRKFQVPQYTQVGNAVPPLLGHAIGKVIKEMLNRSNTTDQSTQTAVIQKPIVEILELAQ